MSVTIRSEETADTEAITRLTELAFRTAPHSSNTEQFMVNALRRAGQLTISLVAEEAGEIVGHVAISPVEISSGVAGWYGLGPISVNPEHQGKGIGSQLVTTALAELKRLGGLGCVLLGEPAYYSRFGFKVYPGLELPGIPQEYFQALPLYQGGEVPTGSVRFHEAFEATE